MVKKITFYKIIVSISCIIISLSIYQAYIAVTITLCLLYILLMLLEDKDIYIIIKQARNFFCLGVVGIAGYLFTFKLVQFLVKLEPAESRGFSSMAKIPLNQIPVLLRDSYVAFFQYFFTNEMINNNFGLKKEINFILLLFFLFLLIYIIIKQKLNIIKLCFILFILFVLPIAVFSIVIMAPEVSIYGSTGVIMLPTTNYIYIFICIMLSRINVNKKIIKNVVSFAYFFIILIIYSLAQLNINGQIYLRLVKNQMQFTAYQIVSDIDKKVSNSTEYKLCIIGDSNVDKLSDLYPEIYESIRWTTYSHGMVWNTFDGTQGCWRVYIKEFLGRNFESCTVEEYEEIVNSDLYKETKAYPQDGIGIIDDVIFIKFDK